ncbi:hypothetical protein ACFSTA_00255 [Ornithinibacillus salinisoli]|uniref:Multidrug transporter n=1 Tax=Ornithinibacillus salinisoli TaxID=1848459 RepID=A0ABW4VWQ7_9BACI
MNKQDKNKPELATFTLLNPDFHPMESVNEGGQDEEVDEFSSQNDNNS